MVHFTCDLCGKELRPGEESRYVVKIEAFAARDPAEITDADLDDDHMEEVSQLLRDMDEEAELDTPQANRHFRYDLCQDCHQKFARDPLGKEHVQKLHFSKN